MEVLLPRVDRIWIGCTDHHEGRYVFGGGTGNSCAELSSTGSTLTDLDCRDDEEERRKLFNHLRVLGSRVDSL